mmetsp:Transcript_31637/g.58858  ORF Transcript_31637/g.58858 Transcript_31637/m.58858 type:complete len:798 (+) Transcript_31637:39-2432(+)
MPKRHYKGNNKKDDKRRRAQKQAKWQATPGRDRNQNDTRMSNYDTYITLPHNDKFEAYYRATLFENDEADYDLFLKALRTTLPACFRINSNIDEYTADELKSELMEFVGKTQVLDGKEIKALESLQWYPQGNGYKIGTDRKTIRKLAGLEPLHKWMIRNTDSGNITRQEAVSMVPPLALNAQACHKCLDMCAAPGSKTSQLLEVVNLSLPRGTSAEGATSETEASTQGLVLANDSDTDRAYMLVHQCKRINSPLLMITTHLGQDFPTLVSDLPSEDASSASLSKLRKNGFFDRVLCDVPCSGDGTMRKQPNIWGKWNTASGFGLHPLQLQIAERGFKLLKPGGLMVYSTCSMSPYEDESVIAQLLRNHPGEIELVDARQFVPNFKCREGLTSWPVLDDSMIKNTKAATNEDSSEGPMETDVPDEKETSVDNDEQEQAATTPLQKCLDMGMVQYATPADVPDHLQRKIRASVFPPTAEEVEWMNLAKCMRCVPQDEDTGGFFVATLRKIPPSPSSVKVEEATVSATEDVKEQVQDQEVAAPQKGRQSRYAKKLIELKPWDEESFNEVRDFYGLEGVTANAFYTREDFSANGGAGNGAGSNSKSIYYLPPAMRSVLEGDCGGRLKVVSAGVKVLERRGKNSFAGGGDCGYRVLQDGIETMSQWVTTRKVSISVQDCCNFLEGGLVSLRTLSYDLNVAFSKLKPGSCICTYVYSPDDVLEGQVPRAGVGPLTFSLVVWRGSGTAINVMAGKVDTENIKHKLETLGVWRPKVSNKDMEGTHTEGEELKMSATGVDATEKVA